MAASTITEPPIEVQLIADFACPWCYLGLARFERARAMRPERAIELVWRPFFLNPGLPPDGMDRTAYLRAKFGAEAGRVYGRIAESGRADGIRFAFERMRRTPNTLQAHRLALHAAEHGRGEAMIEALFRALFEDGRDIGADDQLAELGQAVGLERDATTEFLAGDALAADVVALHQRAEKLGVRGVPVFVVDREQVISGAQPPEALVGLFDLAHTGATTSTTATV